MEKENIIEFFKKSKEWIIFGLLSFWTMIPLLKELKITSTFFYNYQYFILIIMGTIGVCLLIIDIYNNYLKNKENLKEFFKSILPMIFFLLYMIWTLVSSICSPNRKLAFYGTENRHDGYIAYMAYAGFFGFAFLLKSQKLKKILLNVFLCVSMLNVVFFEFASRGFFRTILKYSTVHTGIFNHFNHYGYYLLIVTMLTNFLFIMEKKKVLKVVYGLAYSVLLYYLIYNNTFGCYLALIVTLILFFGYCIYKKQKRILASIPIVIFIIMSFCVWKDGENISYINLADFGHDFKKIGLKIESVITKKDIEEIDKEFNKVGTTRMELWRNGIKFFLERPVLGYGPDNLGSKYEKIKTCTCDRPHNLFIQLATTSGFPGLILYVSGLGIILIRALKTMKLENELQMTAFFVVIAYLVSAMFGNSTYYISPYFFVFLGFIMSENGKNREE